jgi:hypothetical protein
MNDAEKADYDAYMNFAGDFHSLIGEAENADDAVAKSIQLSTEGDDPLIDHLTPSKGNTLAVLMMATELALMRI